MGRFMVLLFGFLVLALLVMMISLVVMFCFAFAGSTVCWTCRCGGGGILRRRGLVTRHVRFQVRRCMLWFVFLLVLGAMTLVGLLLGCCSYGFRCLNFSIHLMLQFRNRMC